MAAVQAQRRQQSRQEVCSGGALHLSTRKSTKQAKELDRGGDRKAVSTPLQVGAMEVVQYHALCES